MFLRGSAVYYPLTVQRTEQWTMDFGLPGTKNASRDTFSIFSLRVLMCVGVNRVHTNIIYVCVGVNGVVYTTYLTFIQPYLINMSTTFSHSKKRRAGPGHVKKLKKIKKSKNRKKSPKKSKTPKKFKIQK